jgi:hypothetical protein
MLAENFFKTNRCELVWFTENSFCFTNCDDCDDFIIIIDYDDYRAEIIANNNIIGLTKDQIYLIENNLSAFI